MATLILTKLWLNLVATGDAVSGPSDPDRTQSFEISADVQQLASGRQRAVSTAGERGSIPFTLVALDLATKDYLRTWLGLNVQVRDHRGQKWYGIFSGLSVTEYKRPDLYRAAFTLLTTSTDESV